MDKLDTFGWAVVVGGLGLLGYAGYTGIRQLPWLADNQKGGVIHSSESVSPQQDWHNLDSDTQKSAESDIGSLQDYRSVIEQSGEAAQNPAITAALDSFIKQYNQYMELAKRYEGMPYNDSAAMNLQREYNETMLAQQKWQILYEAQV